MADTLETTEILITDLEEIRDAISACLTFFTARDVQTAQVAFGRIRPSPITRELERVKERTDGILGDFLLARYHQEKSAGEYEVADDEEVDEIEEQEDEQEEGGGGGGEDDDALPTNPLGSPRFSTRIRESQHAGS